MMAKLNLAVIFGSKSVEHEVSIVTALQIIENADKSKYEIIPIYIAKDGNWYTGKELCNISNFRDIPVLIAKSTQITPEVKNGHFLIKGTGIIKKETKIDIVIPAIHGTFGEDGTIQGFLEMAGVPYVGSGVTASAVGMDKIMQKDIFEKNDIPVVDYVWFLREQWQENQKEVITKIEKKLKYPVFVKPANLGSSVAISKAKNSKELIEAVNLSVLFDRRIIVEEGKENIIEINCSVVGYKNLEVSICEQPIRSKEILSYEDKYLKGSKTKGMASLSRLMPAPISSKLTSQIQETAKQAFEVIDASGLARIDFLVDPKSEKYWICEINTLPGSFSFYLWEKTGYPFPKLIDKAIELAYERFNDRKTTNYSFSSNLLQTMGKGTKN